jgi:hypothetical protein
MKYFRLTCEKCETSFDGDNEETLRNHRAECRFAMVGRDGYYDTDSETYHGQDSPPVTASECIEILKWLASIQSNPKLVMTDELRGIGAVAQSRLAHLLKESAK